MENDHRSLNENKKKNKKKLKKLIEDFNNIKIKAKDTLDYWDHLVKIEEDYLKNKNKNGVNEYYDKVCRGIEKYINFEKSLIIVDNFNSLCF